MGRPKALVRDADGTSWLIRAIEVLRSGGCSDVTVVLGASADEAVQLLHAESAVRPHIVRAADWATGMGASLRAGLGALADTTASAALVHLVDLPDVGPEVVARVLAATSGDAATLARASYRSGPGHPVLLGCDHWAPIVGVAGGDRGARDYLVSHAPLLVPCDDLASGDDVDRR